MAFAIRKSFLIQFFDFGPFRAIFGKKPFLGPKVTKLKIELSLWIFEVLTSPLSMWWTCYELKCEKTKIWKILIFVEFLFLWRDFPKKCKITIIANFFCQFLFMTQKYRSREGFMVIFSGVFFRRPKDLKSAKFSQPVHEQFLLLRVVGPKKSKGKPSLFLKSMSDYM